MSLHPVVYRIPDCAEIALADPDNKKPIPQASWQCSTRPIPLVESWNGLDPRDAPCLAGQRRHTVAHEFTDARAYPLTSAELGDRLRKARRAAGITQAQASAAIGVSRPTLAAIERGTRRLEANELLSLAECYGTGLNRILSPSAVHLDIAARFRGLGRNRAEFLPTVSLLNKLASANVELERLLGVRPQTIPLPEQRITPSSINRQAEEAALSARYTLGLGLAPVPNLVTLLEEEIGFRIFVRDLPRAISGAFAYEPEAGACILLNARHGPDRHVMIAAHELGHFASNRSCGDIVGEEQPRSSTEERFATRFSYAFLMPAATVRRRFLDFRDAFDAFTPTHLVSMARSFQVTAGVMSRRLECLDLLPSGTSDSLQERGFAGRGSSHRVPSPYGRRLYRLAAAALSREVLSEGQVSRMLDLDRVEVRKIADEFSSTEEVCLELQAQ